MTNKENIDRTLKLWGFAINEFEGMQSFFTIEKLNDQFYRRIILKNLFSMIETYLFMASELVKIKIIIEDELGPISFQERALLMEKRVTLNQKGEVIEKDEYHQFIPKFRFTMNMFAKAFEIEPPDYSNKHYAILQTLVKRRNDVTHPKSYLDVRITDLEIKELIPMFGWFMDIHGKTHNQFLKWLTIVYPSLQ